MGKDKGGFLTPKAIANRIKAKGLQKLRWYCQMCEKQCRDENGFKCHLTSESHQRQLLLFADNPNKYVGGFSKEFQDGYLELLKRRYGTKRVQANNVYQEYISERHHIHMNATRWTSLTGFVKWLGREGHCVVDETEKGWFVQYIDRDPETIWKQEAAQKKEKMELDDQERAQKFIEQQIKRASATGKEKDAAEFTELQRQDEEEKVAFSLGAGAKPKTPALPPTSSALDSLSQAAQKRPHSDDSLHKKKQDSNGAKKKKSALDEIMEVEERKKESSNRKDNWLHEGIVVKVITKKLGDKYKNKKGVIREVVGLFGAVIKMIDSGDKIKVDQAHLETVIPGIGKPVLIVNGAYRGAEATLIDVDQKRFCCCVKLSKGPLNGRVVDGVAYEDLSKLQVAS